MSIAKQTKIWVYIILATIFCQRTLADIPDQRPTILSWTKLDLLSFKDRQTYSNSILPIIAKLEGFMPEETKNYSSFLMRYLIGAEDFAALAAGTQTTNGPKCIIGGFIVDSKVKGSKKWCPKPQMPLNFCGKEYKCDDPNALPCNPMVYGFKS